MCSPIIFETFISVITDKPTLQIFTFTLIDHVDGKIIVIHLDICTHKYLFFKIIRVGKSKQMLNCQIFLNGIHNCILFIDINHNCTKIQTKDNYYNNTFWDKWLTTIVLGIKISPISFRLVTPSAVWDRLDICHVLQASSFFEIS